MAEYNPSKIIKDGNTYNFRDTTKIPLAGSNQISGDLIPSTDNSIDIGSSTKNIKMLYTKGITIDGAQFSPSDYIPRSGGDVLNGYIYSRSVSDDVLRFTGGTAWANGAGLALFGKDRTSDAGVTFLKADNGTSLNQIALYPNGMFTQNVNGTIKHVAMYEDVIPRSGGAVFSGYILAKTDNTGEFLLCGGTDYTDGGFISLCGINHYSGGHIIFGTANKQRMYIKPDGTWTWTGQAVQLVSDQRYKQQITEIDDKLLDAWQDVDLVQFKYNDAVDQKGDNARLHTGYVVQQIDDACKKHNVDVSKYGLYCHEEYAEETREVEHDDGTKTTEVVRPASEHYSLRYTEALIVECAYLRKKLKELTARIEQLEKGNNVK